MRIVFFGTPEFAADILEHIVKEKQYSVVGIVSKPDKPKGRNLKIAPTPVKEKAIALLPQVPLFQPKRVSTPEMVEELQKLQPDLFVVVAYGEIIKPLILSIPRLGCINIHASLLPHYRGAAPMQRSLIDGVQRTGVTIMRMDEGLDSGDVLLTKSFDVPSDMDMAGLFETMLSVSKSAISEGLHRIHSGVAVFTPQDHSKATFAPKITPVDLLLDPMLHDAHLIHNRVRALSPRPGAFFSISYKGSIKRLKVLQTIVVAKEKQAGSTPVIISDGSSQMRLCLPHDSSHDLLLARVQLEGKKEMTGEEFMRGTDPKDIAILLT